MQEPLNTRLDLSLHPASVKQLPIAYASTTIKIVTAQFFFANNMLLILVCSFLPSSKKRSLQKCQSPPRSHCPGRAPLGTIGIPVRLLRSLFCDCVTSDFILMIDECYSSATQDLFATLILCAHQAINYQAEWFEINE